MQMTFYKISTIDIKTFAENRSNSLKTHFKFSKS